MSDIIQNGDFKDGLRGWHVVSGQAFTDESVVLADSILADDVVIDGQPVVPLGGNYWHVPYPLAEKGTYLLRVSTSTMSQGVLDSDIFKVELPYLVFRLGGSATTEVALELRVPAANAGIPGFPALDRPDADGFVAVRIQNPSGPDVLRPVPGPIRRQNPSGSDILRQFTWDLTGRQLKNNGLLKSEAKVRLRIRRRSKKLLRLRLAVTKIQLLSRPPRPFHLPLWGWADIHCHPMAQAGFGGLIAGHMHGPIEDLGSCLHDHGLDHSSFRHLAGKFLQADLPYKGNDGSLAVSGWTVGAAKPGDELGFKSWPMFDDLIHIKTHQDWIKRSYDGGQRLMVALVVHNELLASLVKFPPWLFGGQSDRDVIEPQVQMLKEFVAHNRDWCGLAKTPAEARALVEQNKMAFVLGLETDSINGWITMDNFKKPDGTEYTPDEIRDAIYPYFEYLRNLGIVQINLVHLTDNAFGGMALYETMSLYNTWHRTGRLPESEDDYAGRSADEQICKPLSLPSALMDLIKEAAQGVGIKLPQAWTNPQFPRGDRNKNGMTIAGEVALRVAMKLGMVIDMDHMSEKCTEKAFEKAMKAVKIGEDEYQPYPLIVAHNGARKLSLRPLSETSAPVRGYRYNPEVWPSEGGKSETQLDYIIKTGAGDVGIFGHGTAVPDQIDCPYGTLVVNDCPGTTKSFAQGYQYVSRRLNLPVALGTDLNVLLAGLGPRFGPRSANGLVGEITKADDQWKEAISIERLLSAEAQKKGVRYSTHLRDWRAYRFQDSGLYDKYIKIPGKNPTVKKGEGHLMWQAMALLEAVSNDPQVLEVVSNNPQMKDIVLASALDKTNSQDPYLDVRVFNMVAGMIKSPLQNIHYYSPDYYQAGQLMEDESVDLSLKSQEVRDSVLALRKIRDQWKDMSSGNEEPLKRCTAGPVRDFDFNLDGLAHYGMLPDMLQDLKNVGLSLDGFFHSVEGYIRVWERCAGVGARIQL